MNFVKWIIRVVFVFLILYILSLAGAISFPSFSGDSIIKTDTIELAFLLLSIIVLTIIAYLLGRGIRSMKGSLEAAAFAYISALIVGGVLALLTLFNFPYAVHVNLSWLGSSWYEPWIIALLIGAPIMLIFVI